MSDYIVGQNEILSVWNEVDDAWQPLICLSSNGLSENADTIEGRTKCDLKGAKQTKAGAYSYELPFEGMYVKSEEDKLAWADLRTMLRSLENFDWMITTTYNDSSTDIEYGNAFFSNLEKTAATDEFISFSGSLVGNGLITAIDPHAV